MRNCGGCGEPYEAAKYSKRCEPCKDKQRVAKLARDGAAYVSKYRSDPVFRRKQQNNLWKSKYGISLDDRDHMLEDQGGLCPICGTDSPVGKGWVVDHDHSTGEVRGIICALCNGLLGFARDDVDTLTSAISYLLQRERIPAG